MNTVVKITSKLDLRSRLEKQRKRLESKLPKAVEAAADVLLDKSLAEVPRDTHELAKSGRVRVFGFGFTQITTVGYGGYGLPPVKVGNRMVSVSSYAIYQHRGLTGSGARMAHVQGKDHYLSDPLGNEQVRQEMRAALRAVLAGA